MTTTRDTESSDSTGARQQGRVRTSHVRRRTVVAVLSLVGILLVAGFFCARPLYFYVRLTMDAETRSRCAHIHRLARSRYVGRVLARSYVHRHFRKDPSCGTGFALQERQLWMGMTRAKLARCFGPPDATDGPQDVWYTYRRQLLRRLRTSRRPPFWDEDWYRWYICMIAEYDGDNQLSRLALSAWPGDVVIHYDINRVPFQWSTSVPETASIPPEPAEWVEERRQNTSAPASQ